jgi:ABC-type nitrate/sulfonate/bicarbonate transport system substrate-binding protein
MTGLAEAVSLLAKGEIDVAVAAVTGAFLSAQAQKLDVRFVISQGQENPDKPASGFYVRPELFDNSTVNAMADLRGRKVALFGSTGSSGFYLFLILKQGNLGLSDVELAPMQYAYVVGAMRNGAIDAAIISAPFNTLVEQEKSGRRFGYRDALARLPITAIAFGPNLLQKRPQVACAYVRASLRADDSLVVWICHDVNPRGDLEDQNRRSATELVYRPCDGRACLASQEMGRSPALSRHDCHFVT